MLKKEILKSKNNGNGVDSEPLAPWCGLLKKLHEREAADDTTALLTVNSVTVRKVYLKKVSPNQK